MTSRRGTRHRNVAGKVVRFVFAYLVGWWLVLESGWLPAALYGPLLPFWLSSYVAVYLAALVRHTLAPWLESGLLFDGVVIGFLYLEAVLLAGPLRFVSRRYRTYRRNREQPRTP